MNRSFTDNRKEHISKLYTDYFRKIVYFIASIIKNTDAAEDITQDLFIKLFEGQIAIDADKNPESYLFAAAKSRALNFLRHQQVEQEYAGEMLRNLSDWEDPYQQILTSESYQQIETLIEKMPEQRKKIFQLSRQKGLSNDEIANQLAIKKKRVEYQLHSALKEIRRKILIFF